MRQRISSFLAVSTFLLFTSSCIGVEKYFVSKPVVDSNEIRVTQNGEIKIGDVAIVIRPANVILQSSGEGMLISLPHDKSSETVFRSPYYVDRYASSINFFILEIIISPAKNNLTFSARSVSLETPDGKKFLPVSYKKLPVTKGWYSIYYPKYSAELCQQVESQDSDINQPLQLSEEQDVCLAIKYNIPPPDPRGSFAIQIKGLRVNEKNINVPVIKFVPGIHRHQHA